VVHGRSGGRLSPRKLIPVNPKTTGDHILLQRIAADLSQMEMAVKAGVSERVVRAWEHDQMQPTEAELQIGLASIWWTGSECMRHGYI
jgi:DNA-binding transcriptional regulator YiaG